VADDDKLAGALATIEAAFGSSTEAQEMAHSNGQRPAETAGGLVHVPDPTRELVGRGWAENVAKPAIQETTSWARLDELEQQIRAMVGAAEALFGHGQAVYELRCAWRLIEIRRGQLLGPAPGQGARTDLQPPPSVAEVEDVPERTANRLRALADHAELVEAHLWSTDDPRRVTQTAVLGLIQEPASPAPEDVALTHLRDAGTWIAAAADARERDGVTSAKREAGALARIERALARYRAAMEAQ
jgi:hypothetical protein